MSLMVQNNYLRESSMVANTRSKQSEEKVFSQELTSKQINGTEKTEQLTPEEELEVFKKEFYEELSKINIHQTISNVAINISEDAFKKMKEDPQYKQQILNLLKRDLGSSLAPRNCSAVFTVGSSLKDYRGDSWPVGYDSEFYARSQDSFYKKTSESKKDKQKELLEEYLEKRQEAKRISQEILDKKLQKEEDMRQALRKSDAEKAYNNQILYK